MSNQSSYELIKYNIYMGITTQNLKIYNDSDPLDFTTITVPIKEGVKVLSHEDYTAEALKKYDMYCTSEMMDNIASYEGGSFKTIREGIVSSFDDKRKQAIIDLSCKHSVAVDINTKNEQVEIGKKIDVVVTKKNGKIVADASSKMAQIERIKQELIKQIQTPTTAYAAMVKEVVFNNLNTFNGFMVDINGLKCFMPGAESDVVPLNDYNCLLGESLYVMPVATVKESIVVSHKEYLNTLKPKVLRTLEQTEKNTLITGKISSVKHFGVFILIGECVPTLLSVSEMNEETENKFKNDELVVGDDIQFYIDNINGERVIITQTVSKSEGWDKLKNEVDNEKEYNLNGVVKNVFNNGVVIISEKFNGITFFLSSKVVKMDTLEVGKEVILPVDSVDTIKKTVRLRISE